MGKKTKTDHIDIKFIPVLEGGLALFHRPSIVALEYLQSNTRLSTVFTLQGSSEEPFRVQETCKDLNLDWVWLDLKSANKNFLLAEDTMLLFKGKLVEARQMLNNGLHILVHCHAGVHRTGIFGYALMRIAGFSDTEAFEAIRETRIQSYKGCGAWRFELAERLASDIISNLSYTNIPGVLRSHHKFPTGLLWVSIQVYSKSKIEIVLYATSEDVKLYLPGPSLPLNLPKGLGFGKYWGMSFPKIQGNTQVAINIPKAEDSIIKFCQESFENRPVLCGKGLVDINHFFWSFARGVLNHIHDAQIELLSLNNACGVEFQDSVVKNIEIMRKFYERVGNASDLLLTR